MANQKDALKKDIKLKKKNKMPTKKTINLAVTKKEGINWLVAVPAILLICAMAAFIGKVAVVDRLNELYAIRAENSRIQSSIDEYYRQIESYSDVQEEYYHYTYTGWTSEEKNRADRVEVLDLMDRCILERANVDSWSVSGNSIYVTVSDISLAEANQVVAELEGEELVNYCILTTATTDNSYNDDIIKANITVYLNGPVDLKGGAK